MIRVRPVLVVITVLSVLVPAGGASLVGPAPPASATVGTPLVGVLGVRGHYFGTEAAAGIDTVTVTVNWDEAEPSPGTFDPTYLHRVRTEVAAAHAAGLSVSLDPGLQITPNWVFGLTGGTRYVDQYGDAFTGSIPSGNHVPNAVTDLSVRAAEGTYLWWLGRQFTPGAFVAVRQGGGPLDETRYPGPDYAGHTDCFWAYDTSSQAALPPSVRGWVPGTGTTAQAQIFLDAYNHNLVTYSLWLYGQLRADFTTDQLVLLPGWGERPGGAATEVASRLTADLPEFNEGLDWIDLLRLLPDVGRTVAYTTYLDAPTHPPGLPATLQLEDPADFLAALTAGTHRRLGGENTGGGSIATLRLCAQRSKALGFLILNWMDESQLVASTRGQNPSDPTFSLLGASVR